MSDEELLQLLLQEKLDQLQNIYSVPSDKDIIKNQIKLLLKIKSKHYSYKKEGINYVC